MVDAGHVYLAKPPLFELVRQGRKNSVFIYDESGLDVVLDTEIARRAKEGLKVDAAQERFRQAGL